MSPLPGIISDTFGQLGDTVKQAGQQAAQLPSDLFETGVKQVKSQSTQTDKGDQDTARERSVVAGGRVISLHLRN